MSVVDSNGTRLLDNLSFRMAVGDAVALDGGTTSGAETIVGVLARLESAAGDPSSLRRAGVEIATELSARLLDGGAPGLHFYTLNRSTATLEVFADLGVAARR